MRCPHCTNQATDLLEALDAAHVMWLCHVCARTFANPWLSGASGVNRVDGSRLSSDMKPCKS